MLLAFTRIRLEAGETRRVTFVIPPSRLAFYDPGMRFVVEPDSFTISAGSSSEDIRAEGSITLGGEIATSRQREVPPVQMRQAGSWVRTGEAGVLYWPFSPVG